MIQQDCADPCRAGSNCGSVSCPQRMAWNPSSTLLIRASCEKGSGKHERRYKICGGCEAATAMLETVRFGNRTYPRYGTFFGLADIDEVDYVRS